ncbi:QueT transporter [Anaerovirgula multivorans]|uniref:QueT transporter n=1 Tax=Anaerovirgula multivorans TaxID=312168 RepID=A0A239EC26_9FIRM|nr:QueT transporter family protein [Anaerovirgula multivorans]SNS41494.1 QueT transporter [Anaerovirgula multivorans]
MKINSNLEKNSSRSKSISSVNKLTISGIVIALYIAIMFFTQGFAFGQFQVRIATSLYALTAIYPFLIIPMGISNFLSNTLMGGLGLLDMMGGLFVGIVTSTSVYLIKKYRLNDWLIALPIIFGPGLIVPIWLSYLINVPYKILAVSIVIGQIFPGIVGVVLVKQLRNKVK